MAATVRVTAIRVEGEMERFTFRRFLSTIIGRLLIMALIGSGIALAGGAISISQLLRIQAAANAMEDTNTSLVNALTVAHESTELILNIQAGIAAGADAEQLARDTSLGLTVLDSYRQVLLEQARALPPGSALRMRTDTVAILTGDQIGIVRQILQAMERNDSAEVQRLTGQLNANHQLFDQATYDLIELFKTRHEQAREESQMAIRRALTVIPGVAIAVLLTAALAEVIVLRGIVVGVRLLSAAAGRLAGGHLEERMPTQMRGPEEFRYLAHTFNDMAAQLQQLYAGLEQMVAQRTAELARRTAELEAAAQVARRAAEIRDPGTLLNETVHLISDRFGFYHAGIFLIDEAGEYAVLRAASSEGGRRMLARGHRLAVGKVGIVGYVAGAGQPRIALDVGKDAVFFDNPDLPLTRSEMALPLKVGEQVIGVLDVQSTEPAAFTEEDVAILQTLADQLALAIENARLLEESRHALEELERLYGEQTREAWRTWTATRPSAYRYTGVDVEPLQSPVPLGSGEDGRLLTVPIRLWGQTIGSILLRRTEEQQPWTPEEQRSVEEIGEQIALALENARLLEESRQRATQERIIANITARVRASLDPETILQTALRELGMALGADRVFVRLGAAAQRAQED
jgi:GAF domain-containing protein